MPIVEPSPSRAPSTPPVFSPSQLVNSSPTPAPATSPSPAIAANVTPTSTPTAEDEKARQKVEEELDKLAAENGVGSPKEIKTRPFKDLLVEDKKKKDSGELKLDGQIELTVEADRDPDGKLKNAKVTDKRGDKKLEAIALDFISALSDSGVLDFLEGTKHLRLIVKIDDKTVEATASTRVESSQRARTLERTFSAMIRFGRITES